MNLARSKTESKLNRIKDALQGNPNINILKVWHKGPYTTNSIGYCAEMITFIVAPTNNLTPDELSALMDSLIPGLPPDMRLDDYNDSSDAIKNGFLRFEEPIGYTSTFSKTVYTASKRRVKEHHKDILNRWIAIELFLNTKDAKQEIAKQEFLAAHPGD